MLKVRYWLPSGYPASSPELLEEIDREMAELAEAGYSTVELANVYEGLTESEYKALEEGDGEESYLFGSSYWTETLRQVLKSAKTYGMTVDITCLLYTSVDHIEQVRCALFIGPAADGGEFGGINLLSGEVDHAALQPVTIPGARIHKLGGRCV